MTEEIIIFEQDGNMVGITKEGKYFESYKTTENVAILRGAGLYIKRLEQERDELKKTVENQKLEYEELQCDYNELEQRHNDAFEQFKEMRARHNELLASCEQSDQEAAEIINELKQENKELKEENETLNYQWHKQSEIGDEWYKVAEKYKTALEEIKDLANAIVDGTHFTNDIEGHLKELAKEIINIIKEVLK